MKPSKPNGENIFESKPNENMIDWWAGTVIFTFFQP